MTRLLPILAVLLAASLLTLGLSGPVTSAGVNRSDCSRPYWNSRTVPPPSIRVGITGRHDDVSATQVRRIKTVPFKRYVKTVMRVEFPGWIASKRKGGAAYIAAGAVAAKQYAWYWTTQRPRYTFQGKCFDVYDNVRDQVYKPGTQRSTAAEARTNAAVERTWTRIIRRKKAGGGSEFVLPFYLHDRSKAAGTCGGTPPGYKRGYRMFRSNALTCAEQGKSANRILVRSYTPRATRKAFVVVPR
jgi:peptidoglycan hydrolase-like amidase